MDTWLKGWVLNSRNGAMQYVMSGSCKTFDEYKFISGQIAILNNLERDMDTEIAKRRKGEDDEGDE